MVSPAKGFIFFLLTLRNNAASLTMAPRPHQDFDAKYSKWPRRLLHVPSLVSYEWKPGNCYGGHRCPAYNTLSYTWGRYALKEGDQPEVEALEIRFEGRRSWKIPRINPAHFTVEQFRAAIQLATQAQGFPARGVTTKDATTPYDFLVKPTEFLWLDVACIDQEHAKSKLSEINRQAFIFQRAQTSYVWMSHLSDKQLLKLQAFCKRLDANTPEIARPQWPASPHDGQPANTSHPAKEPLQKWLDESFELVQDTLNLLLPVREGEGGTARISAPWFSSLWTLQEAHLRPGARILPRDCRKIASEGLWDYLRQIPSLREVLRALSNADGSLSECLALGLGRRCEIEAVADTVHEAGLREMLEASPFAVFSASQRRQTSDPRDRVYGIMQIFGIQLPLQHRGTLYKPAELQDILSERILLAYPVESQLFVHTEPQAPMSKWRIGTSVAMPTWARSLTIHMRSRRGFINVPHPARPLPLCKFSVTRGSAYFRGRLCSLRHLLVPFEVLDTAKLFDEDDNHPPGYVSTMLNVDVAFDMVPNTVPGTSRLQIPGMPGFLFSSVGCSPRDTHRILAEMAARDTYGAISVLLLGSCLDPLTTSCLTIEDTQYEQFTAAWRAENDEWLVGLILRNTWAAARGSAHGAGPEPFVPSYERLGVCKWYKADCWVKLDGDEDVFVGFEKLTDEMKSVLSGRDKWYEAEGYWG